MKTIAIDLGGTRIKIGLIEEGHLLCSAIINAPDEKGFMESLPSLENKINELLTKHTIKISELGGLGFSMPGIVDPVRMKLISVNEKYNHAVGYDFKTWAKEKWGLPLVLENDARAATVGEWQSGAGKGKDSMVMVTIGTGIGTSAVMNGKVLLGKHFQAGCLGGHFTIDFKGSLCNCGNVGCVESAASSWSLPEIVKQYPLYPESRLSATNNIDYRQVFEMAGKNDPLAMEVVLHSLNAWSACIINLIHAYDPEIVVVGGGIMQSGDKILPHITGKVHAHAWTPWGKPEIVPAKYKDEAALFGIDFLLRKYLRKEEIYI